MRTTATILLSALLLISCSRKRAALHYFNEIIAYTNKASKLRNSYNEKIETAISNRILSKKFQLPGQLRMEFVQKMNQYITRLQNKNGFEGDKEFLDAAVKSFSTIRDFYENEKKTIIEIRSHILPPDEEQEKTITDLEQQIQNKATIIDDEYILAQKKFAEKYGFPIIFK